MERDQKTRELPSGASALVDALIEELGLSLDERAALDRQAEFFATRAAGEATHQSRMSVRLKRAEPLQQSAHPEYMSARLEPDSEDVAIPVPRVRGFERLAVDGERYVAHRFQDGLYRMADPALGRKNHHAENQSVVGFEEISGYLARGYLLRMRGELSNQINLISPSEIEIIY